MRTIINGKMYNTETAKALVQYNNGLPRTDFNHWRATLYKKRTGEFFEEGTGGANTAFGHSYSDNTRCGGSKIIPLTIEEAKKFVEDYGSTDEYIKIFGEPEE